MAYKNKSAFKRPPNIKKCVDNGTGIKQIQQIHVSHLRPGGLGQEWRETPGQLKEGIQDRWTWQGLQAYRTTDYRTKDYRTTDYRTTGLQDYMNT